MTTNLSIHIGLNRVDPNKYEGWDGLLRGCINDANAMRALAKRQGFATVRLIDEDATRAGVLKAVSKAADTLVSGDTLLLTYSGHGGQVPDKNNDEDDGLDETWVLFDGMLIDNELFQLWGSFNTGVRIIMVSDSCHSGTVSRMREFLKNVATQVPVGARTKGTMATQTLDRETSVTAARLIPPQIAEAVYEAHPEIYKAAQFSAFRGDRAEIGASVILLSGCQDNQLSGDTGQGGLFTLRMLDVWNNGEFTGGYEDFVRRIRNLLPSDQQPNFSTTGRKNPPFEAEKPFSVLGEKDPDAGSNGNKNGWREVQQYDRSDVVPGLDDPDLARYPTRQGVSPSRSKSKRYSSAQQRDAAGLEDPDTHRQSRSTGANGHRGAATGVRSPGALRDLIMSIDKISVPFESDIAAGIGESKHEYRGGKRFRVTSTPRTAVNTFESLAAFDVHADVLWPGSMVQGRSLPSGVLQPLALNRAPGTVVLNNLMAQGTSGIYVSEIERPSLGRVQQSVQNLLAQEFEDDTPAKISFFMKQFYSLEHAMMQIGASYSWLSGSAKAELQSSSYSELKNYVVRFVQAYYSVSFEPPGSPEALFAPDVTVEDASLYMGSGNPPAYISTVTYGRMLLVFASTQAEAESLRLALAASFSSMASSGEVNIEHQHRKVLQESEIKVLALGGPSSGVVKLLTNADKAKGLEEYLKEGANFTRSSPGVPIAYQARYLRDNDVARVSFTTNYEVRTSEPDPVRIRALQLRFHTHDDDKDPDARVVVEIRAGGNVVWRGDFGKGNTWRDHTHAPNSWEPPWQLNLTTPVSLEDVRSMSLHGEQADDNSGWNMSYDVWAICDDGSNPHVGGGGYRRIGDDASRSWSDVFSGQ